MSRKARRLFAGIDVSKSTLAVALQGLDGVARDLEFSNDADGHHKLVRILTKGKRTLAARTVVEATSTYAFDLCFALAVAGVEVMVVNPRSARRFADAMMRRAKTDKVDARVLLDFVQRMPFEPWTPPTGAVVELRMISRRIHAMGTQRTAELNRMHALKATTHAPQALLDELSQSIEALESRRAALLKGALELIEADTQLRQSHAHLTEIKGFGDLSAVYLLGELSMLPPDMTSKQLVAHAGLDPRPFQSGTRGSQDGRHISKWGNRIIRHALFMPAQCAARFEPAVQAHYQRLVNRGKQKLVAIVAVMRKLLQAIWIMVRTNSAFDPVKFTTAELST